MMSYCFLKNKHFVDCTYKKIETSIEKSFIYNFTILHCHKISLEFLAHFSKTKLDLDTRHV